MKIQNVKAYLFAALLVGGAFVLSVGFSAFNTASAADFPRQSERPAAHASSTAYTLTWGTSQRIVATSTRNAADSLRPVTTGRSALTVQAINCGTGGAVWLQFNDVAAATSTGFWLAASTTATLGDTVPMAYGSVRALASTANCTLLVTEWRSEF